MTDVAKERKNFSRRPGGVGFDNKHFEYVGSNGSLKLNKKEVSIKHGELAVDEKNSFYLGRHPIRNGDRTQQYRRCPDPIIEFYEIHKEIFDEFDVRVDRALVIDGCFKTNKPTLQRTMVPETSSKFASMPSMSLIFEKEEAIKTVIRKLQIPQLATCEEEDQLSSQFRLTTYPGFCYAEYFNMKTKKEALDLAYKVSKRRWENVEKATTEGRTIRRNELFPNTFAVGARNKREVDYTDGESLTSRPVHMPEFHSEINSATWIDPISEYIKDSARGCVYIGNSISRFERLDKDLNDSVDVIEGDVKRFDASLFITDIIIAVSLSRLYYELDNELIDNHFVSIFDTVGIKDYYTPGGFVYRLIHGLPSGIKATSLYGSFINLVNLTHCMRDKNLKKTKFIVGSDDFLISCSYHVSMSLIDRIKEYANEIGIIFKFLDIKNLHARSFEDRPCFFKYTIDKGEPVTPTKILLERVFIPWNKKYNSNYKILNFLNDLFPSIGAPRSNCFLFYKFYQFMYESVTNKKISLSSICMKHKAMYENVMRGSFKRKDSSHSFPVSISSFVSTDSVLSKEIPKYFKVIFERREILLPTFVKEKVKISTL